MAFGEFGKELKETASSLAPATGLILLFQIAFVRLPWLEFLPIVFGLACTVFGFVLFIQGAKIGLLPLGQGIGTTFIERRAVGMILLFGFLLGLVLTTAEPDVRLLTFQLEEVLGPVVPRAELIGVAALGLGIFAVVALLRLAFDVPIHYILVPGYLLCVILVLFSSESINTYAFDLGAVTTGPMTVPFLMALGVGMASVLGGRDRLKTGFGLMAIGSVGPVLAILIWGLFRGGV
ncbi:DUF1538 domain-containing protein [soil metagenome]